MRTFRESSRKRSVSVVFQDFGLAFGPLSLRRLCAICLQLAWGTYRSQKCAINSLRTRTSGGLLGWVSRGSHQNIHVRISPLFHVSQRAQRSKKFEISIGIENFEREWNFRASHPPRPYFLWGNRDVEIEIFERDQKFRSRSNFSIGIKFFWSLGPLGFSGPPTGLTSTIFNFWRPPTGLT